MKMQILGASYFLKKKSTTASTNYRDVLKLAKSEDLVYMDPPYQGVCGNRDTRYLESVQFCEFVEALDDLNKRNIRFIVSYDGRTGNKSYGQALPADLNLTLIELDAGRSTQATLLGRDDITIESLYLSPALADELSHVPTLYRYTRGEQMCLMEVDVKRFVGNLSPLTVRGAHQTAGEAADPAFQVRDLGRAQIPNATGESRGLPRTLDPIVCNSSWREKASVGLIETRTVGEHNVRVYADRLAIWRKDGERLTWEELQSVKCAAWGDRVAVEVYPAQCDVVNLRHTRHLWTGPRLTEAVAAECTHSEFANMNQG